MRSRSSSILASSALVLACASAALAQTWTPVGPPGNPVVQALLPDPNSPATVFSGTASDGVFVSSDSGGSWSAANLGLTTVHVTALAAFVLSAPPGAPPVPPIVYAGTSGGGVFQSLTRGATWRPSTAA